MGLQTIAQQRAKFALEEILSFKKESSPNERKEWIVRANEMPAMIQMNGLGQTCAFYQSKEGVHRDMYVLLSNWLCGENRVLPEGDLMCLLVEADMNTYRIAQAEAQAFLIWVKKFSKTYCSDEKE